MMRNKMRQTVQLYQEQNRTLVPVAKTIVEILTGSEKTRIDKVVEGQPLWRAEPFGLRFIDGHTGGFTDDLGEDNMYVVSVEERRLYQETSPFRHLDKSGNAQRYYVMSTTTVDTVVEEFIEAGYEVVGRKS